MQDTYGMLSIQDPADVIDLEVIKASTNVPSETTATRDDFRTRLLERDVCCVWSGLKCGAGLHIIPFKRGDDVRSIIFCSEYVSLSPFPRLIFQWLRLIIANRPKYRERVATLNNINDIRNGVFANLIIPQRFDERSVAVLKVCHICPLACLV